jgi:hypothetical protein
VTEQVDPALPVAVRVEPDKEHAPLVANERVPPVVPPVAVRASGEPKMMFDSEVIETVA